VVVGSLNPQILTPQWVAKYVFDENLAVEQPVSVPDLQRGGLVPFLAPFKLEDRGISWQPALNRVQVFATADGADAGEVVAKILEELPHTPVQAVGSNFDFEIGGELAAGLGKLCRPDLASALADDRFSLLGVLAVIKMATADAVLSIAFDPTERPPNLRFNFHRDVATTTDAAIAARHWKDDRQEADRLFGLITERAR
jgi:hypothetical protein